MLLISILSLCLNVYNLYETIPGFHTLEKNLIENVMRKGENAGNQGLIHMQKVSWHGLNLFPICWFSGC